MSKNKNDLLTPNELTPEVKASMRTRIISAVVGSLIVLPFLFMGDYFCFALIAFLLFVASYEIIHCAKKKYCIALYIVSMIMAALMAYAPLWINLPQFINGTKTFDWHLYTAFDRIYVSVAILAVGAFSSFSMVLIDKGFTVRDATFIFTMLLLISVGFQSTLYLRCLPAKMYHAAYGMPESYFNWYDNFESAMLIIYILIGTFVTDGGAYFVGVFFGKHKMNERISPKKTWEGFFGGVIISSFVSFAFAFTFALCGRPIVVGIFDLAHWYYILILSLILPFFSTLGDFVFSSVKRHYEIKDFGNIMPGHGGVLDRLDSMMFTMIVTGMFFGAIEYFGAFFK